MKGKRYTKKRVGEESNLSRNIREMIEMINEESISKRPINFDNLVITRHARKRIDRYFGSGKDHMAVIKDILSKSTRVGEQIAFDGRINVMFSYNQYAVYLSPNLKYVITIHRFEDVTYDPICDILPSLQDRLDGESLRKELVRLHKNAWVDVEKRERKQIRIVKNIDKELKSQMNRVSKGYAPKILTDKIEESRSRLYLEGKKLFDIKLEKRHIGKSLTSVI